MQSPHSQELWRKTHPLLQYGNATGEPAKPSPVKFRVLYRGKRYDEPLPLSFAEKPISNKGIQGARLYIKEANPSGALRQQESHLLHIAIEMKLEHAVAPCLIPPDGLPNVREVISANLRGG